MFNCPSCVSISFFFILWRHSFIVSQLKSRAIEGGLEVRVSTDISISLVFFVHEIIFYHKIKTKLNRIFSFTISVLIMDNGVSSYSETCIGNCDSDPGKPFREYEYDKNAEKDCRLNKQSWEMRW